GCDVWWNDTAKIITIIYPRNSVSINSVSIKADEIYTINLEENPTTGYTWHWNIANTSIVNIESEKFVAPSSNLPGAPGSHVWIVKGLKPGKTEIVFEYYRSFEPDKIEKTIVYKIVVN
ncbi:MAG: hypothetical protein COS15_04040, partial [Caldiserica bacterium CG02_land_8_20_14_3_00_36_38]